MSSSHQGYTQPAPAYDEAVRHGGKGNPSQNHPEPSASSPLMSPDPDDIEDDFKLGVNVAQCSIDIRQHFLRKVYTILLAQLVCSTGVAAVMRYFHAEQFVVQHSWVLLVLMVGAIGSMFAVFAKAQQFPQNYLFLALFTGFEAVSVGFVTSLYQSGIVLKALAITSIVFAALTLFAMQTKYDLSSMAGILYAGLIGFLATGFIGLIFGWGSTMELVYSAFGTLLFSGYVLYDTYIICRRCSPDEFILASLSLYLDFINLFLNILRLLNSTSDD